jgi:hypothetical protein
MATRRHDAHTTRTPQAMVPAQVLPHVRCAQCGFMFFGTPGNRCEICRSRDVPHEDPTAPASPTTEASASVMIAQALGTLPEREDAWRHEMERRLTAAEHRAQALLVEVTGLRESLHRRSEA